MTPRNVIAWSVLAAFTFVGAGVSGLMMYIAWQHNPQGEFYDEFSIHWLSWLGVGFGWFVAVAGVPCLVSAVFTFLSYLRRR